MGSKGAKEVFEHFKDKQINEPNLTTIFADAGYRCELKKWLKKELNLDLQVAKRNDKKTKWQIQPKRWMVERIFA